MHATCTHGSTTCILHIYQASQNQIFDSQSFCTARRASEVRFCPCFTHRALEDRSKRSMQKHMVLITGSPNHIPSSDVGASMYMYLRVHTDTKRARESEVEREREGKRERENARTAQMKVNLCFACMHVFMHIRVGMCVCMPYLRAQCTCAFRCKCICYKCVCVQTTGILSIAKIRSICRGI